MLANKFIIVDYLHTLPIHTQTHLGPYTLTHTDTLTKKTASGCRA